jgi:mono/diheme cytochrome c family protein
MKKYRLLVAGLSVIFFVTVSGRVFAQQSTWHAPASADQVVNPYSGSSTFAAEGKKIYESMCVICHGDKGKGNGAAGISLSPRPANFLAITVRHETDGAIFWKLSEGNPPMAAYKGLLSETQRWQLVNYIRQLEGNSK